MPTQTEKAQQFLALHHGDSPLLIPNPWDRGSARLLASLGFSALATTSSGFAATLGQIDGSVTRDQALANAAEIAGIVDVPPPADLRNCYPDNPAGVAQPCRPAGAAGLAGCPVEAYPGRPARPTNTRFR